MANCEYETLAERRLERLISRLPRRVAVFVRWLRDPSRVWLRAPVALLLMGASFLAILPIFGVWMFPLGVILIAQDIPPLRKGVHRLVNWTADRRPHWFGEQPA